MAHPYSPPVPVTHHVESPVTALPVAVVEPQVQVEDHAVVTADLVPSDSSNRGDEESKADEEDDSGSEGSLSGLTDLELLVAHMRREDERKRQQASVGERQPAEDSTPTPVSAPPPVY